MEASVLFKKILSFAPFSSFLGASRTTSSAWAIAGIGEAAGKIGDWLGSGEAVPSDELLPTGLVSGEVAAGEGAAAGEIAGNGADALAGNAAGVGEALIAGGAAP